MKKIVQGIYLSAFILFCFNLSLFSQIKGTVQGQVKQNDGSPLSKSYVFLFQYNPATKTLLRVDSTITDADGKYKIAIPQQCNLLAKPDISFANELPTYYSNTLFSQKAATVSTTGGETITIDFSTIKKSSYNAGTARMSGIISVGENNSAASNLKVFLSDKDKNPVAFMLTNAEGNFSFGNLPFGEYQVWVDFPDVDNSTADIISLNTLNPAKDNLHFHIEDGSLIWIENNYSTIKDALKNKDQVFSLQLNSLQHDVAEKSLDNAPDGTKILSRQIGEFKNLESLSIDINGISSLPSEIGKLSKLSSLSASLNKLSSLPNEMENLKNLKTLRLAKNNFSKFPEVITKYNDLEVLDFQSNPVAVLPPTINVLKNLKELDLSNCFELSSLPIQIGELDNLEGLNLSNCVKLKTLPVEFLNLKRLKVLDISGTKISAKELQKVVPGCEIRNDKK